MGPESWFVSAYYSSCSDCLGDISPGDTVCSDGTGGTLCEECGHGL